MFVFRFENRIVTDRRDGAYVEHAADGSASAADRAGAFVTSRVIVVRRESDQCRERAMIEVTDLTELRDERGGENGADAGDRLKDRVEVRHVVIGIDDL